MKGKVRTNAMRILDSMGIEYGILEYQWDEEHLDAVHASRNLGVDTEQVFKTIVMKNSENKLFVFCLPADFSIAMKKARAITGSKDIDLLPLDKLRENTGYIRGGCSPLGMIKKYPTFIEETALLEDKVYVSAGERGCMISLSPEDLRRASDATFADFV
ncbi:MAG: Cys-tRNA(Pro) deacylase [Candidatus Ornithospirochaeta sp.]